MLMIQIFPNYPRRKNATAMTVKLYLLTTNNVMLRNLMEEILLMKTIICHYPISLETKSLFTDGKNVMYHKEINNLLVNLVHLLYRKRLH